MISGKQSERRDWPRMELWDCSETELSFVKLSDISYN